jgi:hypothetical protein
MSLKRIAEFRRVHRPPAAEKTVFFDAPSDVLNRTLFSPNPPPKNFVDNDEEIIY